MNSHVQPLRLGLVYQGTLVAEALVEKARPVSIGRNPGCTIDLSTIPAAPARQVVMRWQQGWHIVLPESGISRWSLRGKEPVPSPVLMGRDRCVPMGLASGGSLDLGEFVLLFQAIPRGQPIAMTRQHPVLRLGLVLGDRLLTEQMYDLPGEIVVGPEASATLVLPREEYDGPPLRLRRRRDGAVQVVATAAMHLKVAGDLLLPATATTAELRMNSRARLKLGPYTVLLQVVRAARTQTVAPQGAWRYRLKYAVQTDQTWLTSLAIAAALVLSVVVGALGWYRQVGRFVDKTATEEEIASHIDYVAVQPADIPEKVVDNRAIPLVPNAEPPPAASVASKQAPPPSPNTLPAKSSNSRDVEDRPTARVLRDTTLAGSFADAQGNAVQLFAVDPTGESSLHPTFGGTQGREASSGPGAGLHLEGQGAPAGPEKIVGKRSFDPRVPNAVPPPPKVERPVPVIIIHFPQDPSNPQSAAQRVQQVIARRVPALKRCYDAALRLDPAVEGKVRVHFVLGTAGMLTEVDVRGVAGRFEECIQGVFTQTHGLPVIEEPEAFDMNFVFSQGQ